MICMRMHCVYMCICIYVYICICTVTLYDIEHLWFNELSWTNKKSCLWNTLFHNQKPLHNVSPLTHPRIIQDGLRHNQTSKSRLGWIFKFVEVLKPKVELFSRFWRPRTLYFMFISDFIISIAHSKMIVQYHSWAQNYRSNETIPTSPHWILWYQNLCCNLRKTDFRQLYEAIRSATQFGPTGSDFKQLLRKEYIR